MSKILFGAVYLDHEVNRLGGNGFAYANTTYFRATPVAASNAQSYTIELDTDTSLVTVTAESGAAIVVPRERVKRFEPLPAALITLVADPDAPEGVVLAIPEAKRGPGRPRKDVSGEA